MDGHQRPSLLLLPCPPDPSTKESLSAAYRPPLEAAISDARDQSKATVLVVAVACPLVASGQSQSSKSLDWAQAQALLAGVYGITSVISARLSIPAYVNGGPGSVDVRNVLVDYDATRETVDSGSRLAIEPNNIAVVDLQTFASASCSSQWRRIYYTSSEAGLRLFADYLRYIKGRMVLRQDQLVAVNGGLTMRVGSAQGSQHPTNHHAVVCIGGTFDHLHAGHKLLLTAGALLLEMARPDSEQQPSKLIIGVTGDALLKNKKYAELVQSWAARASGVIDFLSTILELRPIGCKVGSTPTEQARDPRERHAEEAGTLRASFRQGTISVECVVIHDAFGPTITIKDVSCLVVSAETRSGGRAVNGRRADLGWPPLEIFEVPVLDAETVGDDDGGEPGRQHRATITTDEFAAKISSTAIRQAEFEARV